MTEASTDTMTDTMSLDVEVHNLQLRYGASTALRDVSFKLGGGKIVGLLGRNGAGKTSLLSVLAAFRKASGGQVYIAGEDPFENPRIMRQICFIRERGNTYKEDITVKDALEVAESLRLGWDKAYAEVLAGRFKLPLDKNVEALSRGMQSALGVTLGLASRSPLTIFDETYLGMDAPTRQLFYRELLEDYMAHPRTIILSTHLIIEVASLLEEVIILDQGKLLLHEATEQFCARGASVTGPASAVEDFADGLTRLHEQQLGNTKRVMVYGTLEDAKRQQAKREGVTLEPVGLQELFVHLTTHEEVSR